MATRKTTKKTIKGEHTDGVTIDEAAAVAEAEAKADEAPEKETRELIDLLPNLVELMTEQLTEDYKRWGETWKRRPRLNQEFRVYNRFKAYRAEYKRTGQPIPWLKVIGNAWIAIVRENHPDLLTSKDTGKNELIELLPELVEILTKRLEEDYERHGDSWKENWPVTEVTLERQQKYLSNYVTASVPIPWDKVIAGAWIAIARDIAPDLLEA